MIGYLKGSIVDKRDHSLVLDVNGVGYEVFCSTSTMDHLGDEGASCQLYIHTQYRAEGVSLFGFFNRSEKDLFLSLIKVDSVGPKSALNIMSAAPWYDLAHLIEDGDAGALSKLPKISKKTAEHVVVKLKGKLSELILASSESQRSPAMASQKSKGPRLLRNEAQTALSHLGYRPSEIDRTLNEIDEALWKTDLESVIRHALNDLSGNI